MDIKIYNRNFDLTKPFEQYLRDKFQVLERYQKTILSFSVELSRDQHHQKGEVFTVEARINLPHKKSIMVKEVHQDARAAVDRAQEKLTRQLVKFKDKNISQLRKASQKIKALKFWQKKDRY
jgi:ribosomal subunit interface protein